MSLLTSFFSFQEELSSFFYLQLSMALKNYRDLGPSSLFHPIVPPTTNQRK
jgi:hypothetical protein